MVDWSAQNYLKFEHQRTRPSYDLAQAIALQNPQKIVDIGCGPGNSTRILQQFWPNAKLSGFDSSPAMIAKAQQDLPDIDFSVHDLRQWLPDSDTDLLFSNAVFQWLPDHIEYIKRLLSPLKSGAVFAIQIPDNLDCPSHRAMVEVAQLPQWRDKIGDAQRGEIHSPQHYYDAFAPLCADIDIWHIIYNHPLDGHDAIVDWLRSTGLRPFLNPLDESQQQLYLDAYRQKIATYFPLQQDGKVLLPFPRLFMVLTRK